MKRLQILLSPQRLTSDIFTESHDTEHHPTYFQRLGNLSFSLSHFFFQPIRYIPFFHNFALKENSVLIDLQIIVLLSTEILSTLIQETSSPPPAPTFKLPPSCTPLSVLQNSVIIDLQNILSHQMSVFLSPQASTQQPCTRTQAPEVGGRCRACWWGRSASPLFSSSVAAELTQTHLFYSWEKNVIFSYSWEENVVLSYSREIKTLSTHIPEFPLLSRGNFSIYLSWSNILR